MGGGGLPGQGRRSTRGRGGAGREGAFKKSVVVDGRWGKGGGGGRLCAVGIWTKFNAWSFPSVADFVSLYFFHYVCLFFVFLLLLLFFFWQPSWQDSNSNPRDRIRSWLASETRRKMSEKLSERCVWLFGVWGVRRGLIERPMDTKIIKTQTQPKFVAASEYIYTETHKDIHVFRGVCTLYIYTSIYPHAPKYIAHMSGINHRFAGVYIIFFFFFSVWDWSQHKEQLLWCRSI